MSLLFFFGQLGYPNYRCSDTGGEEDYAACITQGALAVVVITTPTPNTPLPVFTGALFPDTGGEPNFAGASYQGGINEVYRS